MTYKVGDLARKTGLSIRALHYYEEIGLFVPSRRSAKGHRLYGDADLLRLLQICSLRHLGLGLDEIRTILEGPQSSVLETIEKTIARLDSEIELAKTLRGRLERVAEALRGREPVSPRELLSTMEAMTMYERYYTQEQLAQLERRRQEYGEEAIADVQRQWAELFAEIRGAIDAGIDPASEAGRAFVERSEALIAAFTGGDPGLRASLDRMMESEPQMRQRAIPDPAIAEFLQKARAAHA